MSILNYNGGAVVEIHCYNVQGKECVAIATDKRYGIQATTVGTNFPRVYEMGPQLFVGLPGFATDTQTVHQRLRFRQNLCKLKESRQMSPKTLKLFTRTHSVISARPALSLEVKTAALRLWIEIIFEYDRYSRDDNNPYMTSRKWMKFLQQADLLCYHIPVEESVRTTLLQAIEDVCRCQSYLDMIYDL